MYNDTLEKHSDEGKELLMFPSLEANENTGHMVFPVMLSFLAFVTGQIIIAKTIIFYFSQN